MVNTILTVDQTLTFAIKKREIQPKLRFEIQTIIESTCFEISYKVVPKGLGRSIEG